MADKKHTTPADALSASIRQIRSATGSAHAEIMKLVRMNDTKINLDMLLHGLNVIDRIADKLAEHPYIPKEDGSIRQDGDTPMLVTALNTNSFGKQACRKLADEMNDIIDEDNKRQA